jgi:hypothetical protein
MDRRDRHIAAAMDLMAHQRDGLALDQRLARCSTTEACQPCASRWSPRAGARPGGDARGGQREAVARYVETAHRIAHAADARLLVTHGLPGSGKTYVSQALLEAAGAVRLRSDIERKRLFGRGAYETTQTAQTYGRLLALAAVALRAGQPVIIDAAFLRLAERQRAAALARELGVPFTILHCHAEPSVLEERVVTRALRGQDASEANVAVLRMLELSREPLGDAEQACTITATPATGRHGSHPVPGGPHPLSRGAFGGIWASQARPAA